MDTAKILKITKIWKLISEQMFHCLFFFMLKGRICYWAKMNPFTCAGEKSKNQSHSFSWEKVYYEVTKQEIRNNAQIWSPDMRPGKNFNEFNRRELIGGKDTEAISDWKGLEWGQHNRISHHQLCPIQPSWESRK